MALAYGLGFVLFVSLLPPTPDDLPEADGIVALTGGGDAAGRGRGAVRERRGQAASDQRRRRKPPPRRR